MTFKKHIQSIFVAFIIIFNGCAEGEWELLEVDYEPVLNVFGLISLDPEVDSFVRVYRTTTLSEESEIFVGVDTLVFGEEVYLDSIYEPAGLIKNAQVSIKANGTSIPFNFVPKQYSWEYEKNVYLDTLGTFTPQSGTTYLLDVTVPGYDSVKGQLLTPEIPVLIDSMIQDTVSTKRTYKIVWQQLNEGKGYLSGRLEGWKIDFEKGCEPDFDRVVDLQEGTYTVPVRICEERQAEPSEPEPFIIRLMTMDENYYEYFIRGEEGGYNNFLLGSGTTAGQSVGIEGALGVFGAVASSKVQRVIIQH
ncbi:MAG: DUF4249 family protein [Candidatus Marinimicrobia bacterium]|nr:DUF4249 family protein [Candidatus Neomarinimicrobiota bacterium]MDP7329766.1 DUF4249 family protein [Candidatus Neomarinimicrobiota bacterium]MDP7565878.1 DUF4249 family protein [Candidatus Neomarinimicrobiota bacterium]